MKIILNEIKKIFNFKITLLLLLGSYVIYSMFISFHIETFPNGRPFLDDYNLTVQMIKDYGHEIDENELEDLKNVYKDKLNEADEFCRNNEEFNKFNVYSYEGYLKACEEAFNNESMDSDSDDSFTKIEWKYLNSDEGTILWEMQELPELIRRYETRKECRLDEYEDEKRIERTNEINSNNENDSILPDFVYENYINLMKSTTLCIITGIVFISTLIFVRDKKNKVNQIQDSCKKGRNIYKSKLTAGFISALLITTIEIITIFILYKPDKVSMYFDANINSVYNNRFWFSMTFIEYIILIVILMYLISIATSFISMFVASKANNYITAIGMQVPVLLVIIKLTENILLDNLFILYKSKYLASIILLVLLAVSVGVTMLSCRTKSLRKDI